MFELSINRTAFRGKDTDLDEEDLRKFHSMTVVLGKASWEALHDDIQQLLLNKVFHYILTFFRGVSILGHNFWICSDFYSIFQSLSGCRKVVVLVD